MCTQTPGLEKFSEIGRASTAMGPSKRNAGKWELFSEAQGERRQEHDRSRGDGQAALVLLRFSGELFAHSRSAISNWTGLW